MYAVADVTTVTSAAEAWLMEHARRFPDGVFALDRDALLSACREHAGLPVRAMIAPPNDIRNAIREGRFQELLAHHRGLWET